MHKARNIQTNEEVAVKMVNSSKFYLYLYQEESRTKYPQLIHEAKILHCLQGGSNQNFENIFLISSSWHSKSIMVWTRGRLQCCCDGSPWPEHGRAA